MLTLVNGISYGSGATTLVYFIAKTRSTLLSKPALIISTSNEKPYNHMMQISKEWESPSLKLILSKMQAYTDVKTLCYKAEPNLYYINLNEMDLRTSEVKNGLNQFLKELRENEVHDGFESVWVDIDNYSGGFLNFVEHVDLILVPLKANILTVQDTFERIAKLRQDYVRDFGMQLKIPLYYCVQMYASQMSLNDIKKTLKIADRFVMLLGYDVELARHFNKGTLSFYISEVLGEPKTTEQKVIYNHLRRMIKALKPQRR